MPAQPPVNLLEVRLNMDELEPLGMLWLPHCCQKRILGLQCASLAEAVEAATAISQNSAKACGGSTPGTCGSTWAALFQSAPCPAGDCHSPTYPPPAQPPALCTRESLKSLVNACRYRRACGPTLLQRHSLCDRSTSICMDECA